MTFAYWCVLIAALMPLVWVGVAKFSLPGYDNNHPRESLAQAKGRAQRAHWAEQNALEAFAPFAAGTIIAHLTGGAEQLTINILTGLFIVARIIHGLAYIADRGPVRSFAWLAGMICILGLFIAAA